MMCVGEHIDWGDISDGIFPEFFSFLITSLPDEDLEVTSESGRIA